MENNLTKELHTQKFNLKKAISTYTSQWKWFLISLILFVSLAFIYLRYTIPQYLVSSEVMLLIDNDDNANQIFKELSISSESESSPIDDEILVFKSRNVIRNVVNRLNLNYQYFTQGLVLESEIYKNPPILVDANKVDSLEASINHSFYVDILTNEKFNFRQYEDDIPKEFLFGEEIKTIFGNIIVTSKIKSIGNWKNNAIRVKISDPINIVESLRNKIYVYNSKEASKVLTIDLEDPVVEKAKDVIRTLIEEYDKYTAISKNKKSEGTANLIDERILKIFTDLDSVDKSIASFKVGNKVTDVSSQAGEFMSQSFQNEQEIENIKTQLKLLNFTKERLASNSGSYQTVPTNLGDESITLLSNEYNQLLVKRELKLKSAGEKNSVVQQLDQSISQVRRNLTQNINATIRTLNIQLSSLQNQYQRVSSKISSVPGQENKLKSIERSQGIKESIYLYLLQKKEEAIISQTVTSSNVKIIDDAYSLGKVSPNSKILYIGALFVGLFLPFGFFYVKDLLDFKIHNKEDLKEEIKNITILGEIPRLKSSDKRLIEHNDRSILSESFRIIRTNFEYVRKGRQEKRAYENIIFVTSTINGEGKSFFSMNLALTMVGTNKRVLLVGADIRNPQIFQGLNSTRDNGLSKIGLTEFIADDSTLLGEIINEYNVNNVKVDVLLSGKVPPNPAELLMNDRVKTLFDSVSEQYDYVIVDTAPAMLVTDTFLISEYSGHTIYLTRADYTEKQILNFAREIHSENKLNGMMLVVNDVKQSNFGYGAKYGYYGAPKKKGFFRRKA